MVQGDEEEPRLMSAALYWPSGYTPCFTLGWCSELVPGSTDIPTSPSHSLLLSPLPVADPPQRSPSLFVKLAQCSHRQEHSRVVAEQTQGCFGAELHLILIFQKPSACSLHLLDCLWYTGDVPGRGTWCQHWLLAAFPPPLAHRRKVWEGRNMDVV